MGRIIMMDCTLRDGGWVNQFRFGTETMKDILTSLQAAGIRYIELGYLDEKNGKDKEYSMYSSFDALAANGLTAGKKGDAVRMVMVDYGKFPLEKIPEKTENTVIDGIRLCFHKDKLEQAVEMGKEILKRGYQLYFQPMVTTRYSDEELKAAIGKVQQEVPEVSTFYIVDSFGVMDENEIRNRILLADRYLDPKIRLGLHTHNNRNISFANAKAACELLKTDLHPGRELSIDGTLAGIGKGAGNLCTEEFARYLNRLGDDSVDAAKIQDLTEKRILPLRKQYTWGCSPMYELTSLYRATPTYAKMLCEEYGFSLEELEQFLMSMPEEKKDSFNREFAQNYFKEMKAEKA